MKLHLPATGTLKPNDEYDPLPHYYRPLIGSLYRKRLAMGLQLVPEGGSRVLEIGVGSGILVSTLSARFPNYTGADLVLADGLQALVAPGCQARFIRADLLDESALPAESFDLVMCLSVLEHIADADRAAAALARTLATGGTLIAGYPMVNRFMAGLFRTIGFTNIEAHHVTPPATIEKALGRVLRPARHNSLPPFAPVNLALYRCTSWQKT